MVKKGLCNDLLLSDTKQCVCEVCREAKASRMSINRLSRPVAAPPRPFEFVVSDVKGKLPSDINGINILFRSYAPLLAGVLSTSCDVRAMR